MKVIRIVSELDFGGVEQVVANSVPELIKDLKIEVKIVVLGSGGRVEKELVNKGIEVMVLQQNPRIPNFKLLLKLAKFLKEEKPDVVHCQGAEANFHGILASKWAGIKNIIGEEIGIPNHHGYWKNIFRMVYANAHHVIAISEAVKSTIVGLGEVKKEKVNVLYNPVCVENSEWEGRNSDQRFKPEGYSKSGATLSKKPFVFITTCRLVPVKNLDRLISTFAKLVELFSQHPVELWIVGEGPMRDHLKSLSFELGITEKVKFLGFQENVYQFLKMADVFVLPSLSEGSSVSLVEAMSIGLPSIATKVGGTGEILGESHSGILVDPLDEASIVDAMSFFVTLSDNQIKEMGKRAIIEANRFSVDEYLERLLEIYSDKIEKVDQ